MTALLVASAQAAVLAVLVLVLQRVLGDALSPRARYALWWLVVVRLVLPVSVPDPFAVDRPSWWTWHEPVAASDERPADERGEPAPDDAEPFLADAPIAALGGSRGRSPSGIGARRVRTSVGADGAAGSRPPSASPTEAEGAGRPRRPARGDEVTEVRPSALASARADERSAASVPVAGSWLALVPWVELLWLAGLVVFLARAVVGELGFRREVLRRARPAPADAQRAFDAARAAIGGRRRIELLFTTHLPSPAAHGVVRPVVLVPESAWAELDAEAQAFVLRHELAHVRRHDLVANVLLTSVRAAHWFNPVVAFALGRLRDERESLRDDDALNASPSLDADRCARSVLALSRRRAEASAPPRVQPTLATLAPARGASLRRRLEMIVRDRSFRRLPAVLGFACVTVLGWAGLAGSAATGSDRPSSVADRDDGAADVAAAEVVSQDPKVRVVRQVPMPDWEPALEAKLAQTVTWDGLETLTELAAYLGERTDLRIAVERRSLDEIGDDSGVPPLHAPMRLDDALDLACWTMARGGADWTWIRSADGITFVMPDVASVCELRFYDVREILGPKPEVDFLMDHILSEVGGFEEESSSIEAWRERFLIRQTSRNHARIELLLAQLSSGRDAPRNAIPAELRAKLAKPVQKAETTDSVSLLHRLAEEHGVPLFVHPDLEPVDDDYRFDGQSLGEVFATLAHGSPVTLYRGAVVIGDGVPLVTRMHDVGDLLAVTESEVREWLAESPNDDPEHVRWSIRSSKQDRLRDLLRNYVEPASWDEHERVRVEYWNDLLVITQIEPVHAGVRAFLETARRSLRG